MELALTANDLGVRYGSTIGLRGVNLGVPTGSSLAITGPNGSGKSTLLALFAGTIRPTSGSFERSGPTPAFVPQSTEIDRRLPISVRDTVSLARYSTLGMFKPFRSADRLAVDRALARLAIDDLAARQLHELSGGQRQRALVAQGLAQETNLLLLDEPVTGLDVVSRTVILDVIDEELASGRTVIVSTHDFGDARRCQQVLLLDTAPVAVGTPSEVLTGDNLKQAFGRSFTSFTDLSDIPDPTLVKGQ